MLIILLSFVEFVFGIVNLGNKNLCSETDHFTVVQLPVWIISKSVIETILVILLLSYNIHNNGFIKLYCLYSIFFIYFSWLVIGFYLFCEQCLSGENAYGTVFMAMCLINGIILSLINFRVIDFLDHLSYTIHSLEVSLLHRNDNRGGRV